MARLRRRGRGLLLLVETLSLDRRARVRNHVTDATMFPPGARARNPPPGAVGSRLGARRPRGPAGGRQMPVPGGAAQPWARAARRTHTAARRCPHDAHARTDAALATASQAWPEQRYLHAWIAAVESMGFVYLKYHSLPRSHALAFATAPLSESRLAEIHQMAAGPALSPQLPEMRMRSEDRKAAHERAGAHAAATHAGVGAGTGPLPGVDATSGGACSSSDSEASSAD